MAAVKQQLAQGLQAGAGSVSVPTAATAVQEKSWELAALEEMRGLVHDCQQEKVVLQARMDIQELERRQLRQDVDGLLFQPPENLARGGDESVETADSSSVSIVPGELTLKVVRWRDSAKVPM